ncbi:MAG TPA: beta-L-arabinofuranosidase domain-containing protein [Chitinophagaceae bacterium]|nr:beta-L-arabinofuranosidase domain-containing protein [Chitinophagaceae bacterium]
MNKLRLLLVAFGLSAACRGQVPLQKFEFVNFSQVNITDAFWKPKIDRVATKTMAACIYQTEVATPRIRNFEKVARAKGEKFEGIYYDDSDVYKALEAMAYALKTHPDPALEKKADEWIDKIAAAQMPDGYLDTYFELTDISKRWTQLSYHEDYNAGHLIEAAVAYYQVTGKRKLLDVAIRLANHIDSVMRQQNKAWFSGHEEIELALVKLYRVTRDDRYLKLANWYLDQRGKNLYPYGKDWFTPAYWQDVVPVKKQTEITGHAVRAMYLYTGAADVAALTGDAGYMNAMEKVWQDVVYRNMYVTGGIGSSGDNEGFSQDYDLPNEEAYCETCASVGMVLWNQRMSELTGQSQYIDVLERSLYNGALDGLSLSGDRFFYDNPLSSNGQHQRRAWFGTACCPANIARLVGSVGSYIYGQSDNTLWVNLFIGSNTHVKLGKTDVGVVMQTGYPYDGQVRLAIDPVRKAAFRVYLRIPGWAMGQPVPGDLYRFDNFQSEPVTIKVNGKEVPVHPENGYAMIEREWNKGDFIEYSLPMQVNRIVANPRVSADQGRFALQRGPLLYCVEGADNDGLAWNLVVPQGGSYTTNQQMILTEPIVAIRGQAVSARPSPDGDSILLEKKTFVAIPYYAWANRGPGPMQVWLPMRIRDVKIDYQSKGPDGGNY